MIAVHLFNYLFVFEMESQSVTQVSAVAQSWLTVTSASQVQASVLPQPPEKLGLQAPTTMST